MTRYQNYTIGTSFEDGQLLIPEMTPELLKKYNEHFNSTYKGRFEELEKLYLAEHKILERQPMGAEDNRLPIAIGTKVIDVHSSWLTGKPITYTSTNKKMMELFESVLKENDDESINSELDHDMCTFGVAYMLLYTDEYGDLKYDTLSPKTTYMVYSDDISPKPVYAITSIAGDTLSESPNTHYVYGLNETSIYKEKEGVFELVQQFENPFSSLPVIQFKNNKEMMGSAERAKPLIDNLDARFSDLANDMEFGANQLLVIKQGEVFRPSNNQYGSDFDDDMPAPPVVENSDAHKLFIDRKTRIAELPPKWDMEYKAKVNNLSGTLDALRYNEELIYAIAMLPSNLGSKSTEGANTSGEAIIARFSQLDMFLQHKENLFRKSLRLRNRIILDYLNLLTDTDNENDINIIFKRNVPKSRTNDIADAVQLTGITSQWEQLRMIGIEDPDAELERIHAEKEKYGQDGFQKTLTYLTDTKKAEKKSEEVF